MIIVVVNRNDDGCPLVAVHSENFIAAKEFLLRKGLQTGGTHDPKIQTNTLSLDAGLTDKQVIAAFAGFDDSLSR